MTDAPTVPMTEPCPECRFDPKTPGIAAEISALARKMTAPLTRYLPGEDGAALLRTRSEPTVWSPLEYACHVRDVLALFESRTRSMVESDGVELVEWDHEAAVTNDAYNACEPADVAAAIAANAISYGALLESLSDQERAHTGTRPPGQTFTVDTMAVYALHEARHHMLDIGRGLRAARGR